MSMRIHAIVGCAWLVAACEGSSPPPPASSPGPVTYANVQAPPPGAPPAAPQPRPAAAPGQQGVPADVQRALSDYLQILRTCATLEDCAQRFTPIAGGGLVNEDGRSLRQTVPPYSLKKDHQNVRFYADPPQITRVDVRQGQSDGYGASALRGTHYKIWIAKAAGQPGMPAPISIMVPEGHAFVQGPRIVGIGSL